MGTFFAIVDRASDGVLDVTLELPGHPQDIRWDIPPHGGLNGIRSIDFKVPSMDLLTANETDQTITSANMVGGYARNDVYELPFPRRPWTALWCGPGAIVAASSDGELWHLVARDRAEQIPVSLDRPGQMWVSPDGLTAWIPETGRDRIRRVDLPPVR